MNANEAKRGVSNNSHCQLCDDVVEDTENILRTCSEAMVIWQYSWGLDLGKEGLERNSKYWIVCNMIDTKVDDTWPVKFMIIVWYLWKWRNG